MFATWFHNDRELADGGTPAERYAERTDLSAQERATARRIASARLGLHRVLEVDDLLARLEAAFEAQRRFAANASHELRTPLAMMRMSLDVATGKPGPIPVEVTALGGKLREGLDQADRLLEGFLALLRAQHGELGDAAPVSIAALVAAAVGARGQEIAAGARYTGRRRYRRRARARQRDAARAACRQPPRQRGAAQRRGRRAVSGGARRGRRRDARGGERWLAPRRAPRAGAGAAVPAARLPRVSATASTTRAVERPR